MPCRGGYEAILAELARYGASLVLVTQSLARLAALDRAEQRTLRATDFSNLDWLFAFRCSVEDARVLDLVRGAVVDVHDLMALGEYQAAELAATSARRYGRKTVAIERDVAVVLKRIRVSQQTQDCMRQPGETGAGMDRGEPRSSRPRCPTRRVGVGRRRRTFRHGQRHDHTVALARSRGGTGLPTGGRCGSWRSSSSRRLGTWHSWPAGAVAPANVAVAH